MTSSQSTEAQGQGVPSASPLEPVADELDLTWTTDPFTGGRVPTCFASG